MIFPRLNLHIHSTFSDGKNSIEQIVKRSLKLKLEYIAITDHFTNSWKAWVSTLKNNQKISEYLDKISICQNYLIQNNKKLSLFRGIEIDLSSSDTFIKKYIEPEKYDIIIFEYLQNLEAIAFLRNTIKFWKRSLNQLDLPILGLAHFDPSYFIHGNLDVLINFLKKNDVYFEFNSSYSSYYSLQNKIFFEKLKENSIPVAIGCDTHNINNLDNIEEPIEMISYYNLENNFRILINKLNQK
ncbi:MAG: PHP domain-containing protein [Promethearchaeota archaeon]